MYLYLLVRQNLVCEFHLSETELKRDALLKLPFAASSLESTDAPIFHEIGLSRADSGAAAFNAVTTVLKATSDTNDFSRAIRSAVLMLIRAGYDAANPSALFVKKL